MAGKIFKFPAKKLNIARMTMMKITENFTIVLLAISYFLAGNLNSYLAPLNFRKVNDD
jgi:hypothetical protein